MPPINLDVPFLPGHAVTFELQKLAAGMDDALAQLLGSNKSGITVKFKFTANGENVSITRVSPTSPASEVNIPPDQYSEGAVPMAADPEEENSFQINILAMPALVPQESPGTAKGITIKLYAEIALSPSCVFSDIQIGSSFTFQQLPIKIPTLAVFFTGASCGSVPLFVLPSDTSIPDVLRDVHWDARGVDPPGALGGNQHLLTAMNDIRVKILSTLILAKEALDLSKRVFGALDKPWVNQLEGILSLLISSSSFVIDTNGKIEDLGQCVYAFDSYSSHSFGKTIESVLLIGPPSDSVGKYFKCYTGLSGQGNELRLTIPQNTCVAALGKLRNLNEHLFVGTSAVPLIQPHESPPPPQGTFSVWGGAIASIYFE